MVPRSASSRRRPTRPLQILISTPPLGRCEPFEGLDGFYLGGKFLRQLAALHSADAALMAHDSGSDEGKRSLSHALYHFVQPRMLRLRQERSDLRQLAVTKPVRTCISWPDGATTAATAGLPSPT